MWLSLKLRSGLSGALIRSSAPRNLRAVNLDVRHHGLAICLYVWTLDDELRRFVEREITPVYTEELDKLGLTDIDVRVDYLEYAGPGYIADGEHYETPIEHQGHGRMVWFDASMLRPGTLPLDVYDPADNPFDRYS